MFQFVVIYCTPFIIQHIFNFVFISTSLFYSSFQEDVLEAENHGAENNQEENQNEWDGEDENQGGWNGEDGDNQEGGSEEQNSWDEEEAEQGSNQGNAELCNDLTKNTALSQKELAMKYKMIVYLPMKAITLLIYLNK